MGNGRRSLTAVVALARKRVLVRGCESKSCAWRWPPRGGAFETLSGVNSQTRQYEGHNDPGPGVPCQARRSPQDRSEADMAQRRR